MSKSIFISSTIYDLLDVRAELEVMIRGMGLVPKLSDSRASDGFVVSADVNSIETCLANVRASDAVIVVLSQRYGPPLKPLGYEDISATHLEYREARKAGKPIWVYVRDRLEADFGTWRRNQGKTGADQIKYGWTVRAEDHGLFRLLDEHRSLHPDAKNWYSTFTSSIELKDLVARDLRFHEEQARLNKILSAGELAVHVCDLVDTVASGRAGLRIDPLAENDIGTWQDNAIGMLRKIFRGRADDVSVTWLRPIGNGARKLTMFKQIPKVDGAEHYEYGEGEGCAGNVWSRTTAALHSPEQPNQWWRSREGCENATYLCAPVGPFTGNGGVLGVGSDKGFRASELDLEVVKIFASLLSLSCSATSSSARSSTILRAVN